VPLNAAQADKLEQALSTRPQRRVRMQTRSIRRFRRRGVRAGESVIDGSLKGRLQRLQQNGKLGTIYVHQGIGNQRPDQGAHRKIPVPHRGAQRRTVVSVTDGIVRIPRSRRMHATAKCLSSSPHLWVGAEPRARFGGLRGARDYKHISEGSVVKTTAVFSKSAGRPRTIGPRRRCSWAAHRRQGPGELPS